MPAPKMWKVTYGLPGRTPARARSAEGDGWYGLRLVDSQCLAADSFVELTMAAAATSSLMLGTGVTNPVMRPVATLADAAASLQVNSGSRLILGIGRGDSALAHIGLAPAPVRYFERFCTRLRPLLRGEEIPFDLDADNPGDQLNPVEELGLADAPDGIKIRWLPAGYQPVPLDITGTGPRVISIGARLGDALTLAVGADPARVLSAIEFARSERAAAGLDAESLQIGIYATVLPLEDREDARALASAGATAAARFSVMHGSVTGVGVEEKDAGTLQALHKSYDMNMHGRRGSPQSAALSAEFVDAFCIFGPPGLCVDRLQELGDIGVDYVIVQSTSLGTPREAVMEIERAFADSVLPNLS